MDSPENIDTDTPTTVVEEAKREETKKALLRSLGVPDPAEEPGDPRAFKARMLEIGVSAEQLEAVVNAEDGLGDDAKKTVIELVQAFRAGRTVDPVYYPRDAEGKFTGRNPHTWTPGMKSPNPLGRARTRIGLWGRFCQLMTLTEEELQHLLLRSDITLADKVAVRWVLMAVNDGSWQPMLEAINRDEGKVQEKIQIDTPPTPIRFIATPGRKQLEEDTSPAQEDASEAEAEEG